MEAELSPVVIVSSLTLKECGRVLQSLPFLLLFLLLFPSLFLIFFLLLDLEIVLHLLDDEALAVTLVVNTGFLVEESLLIVRIQHFFKEPLSFLEVTILNDLMRLVTQPQEHTGK